MVALDDVKDGDNVPAGLESLDNMAANEAAAANNKVDFALGHDGKEQRWFGKFLALGRPIVPSESRRIRGPPRVPRVGMNARDHVQLALTC
jgi:hypothetical protein